MKEIEEIKITSDAEYCETCLHLVDKVNEIIKKINTDEETVTRQNIQREFTGRVSYG